VTSRSCLSFRGLGRVGVVSGIPGAGRSRPEPGP
jgi:hypothetical protein